MNARATVVADFHCKASEVPVKNQTRKWPIADQASTFCAFPAVPPQWLWQATAWHEYDVLRWKSRSQKWNCSKHTILRCIRGTTIVSGLLYIILSCPIRFHFKLTGNLEKQWLLNFFTQHITWPPMTEVDTGKCCSPWKTVWHLDSSVQCYAAIARAA